jgi:transcriptional regulator with XRE-family HTH domain
MSTRSKYPTDGRADVGPSSTSSPSTSSVVPGFEPAPLPSAKDRGDAIRSVYAGRYTQVELAARLGVAQNTVSRWSTGDIEPSLDDIARIEDLCDVPRGVILRRAGYVVEPRTADEMIAHDARLTPGQRDLVVAAYRAALRRSVTPGV